MREARARQNCLALARRLAPTSRRCRSCARPLRGLRGYPRFARRISPALQAAREEGRLKKEKAGDYYLGLIEPVALDFPGGGAFAGRAYVERIEPSTAEVVAPLTSTCFAGSSLLTRQAQGKGVVYGLSVFPDRVGAKTLVKWCFGKVGIDASVEWPASVTVAKRGGRQVVVNCSDAAVETPVGELEPFEVRLASSANNQ